MTPELGPLPFFAMFLSHWINNPVSRIRAAPVLRPPLANHLCSEIRIVYLYSFLSLTHFTSPFILHTNINLEISILPQVGPHPILQPTGYFSSIFLHPLQTILDLTNLDLICPHNWRVLCCKLSFISNLDLICPHNSHVLCLGFFLQD